MALAIVSVGQVKKKTTTKKASTLIKFTFQKGLYLGQATNTTTANPVSGDAEFNLISANPSTGEINVGMSFTNGLCGEGKFTGIIDETGFSLSGILSCSTYKANMITRCSYKDSETLYCQYKLTPTQKGHFTVSKYKNTTVAKKTTTYVQRYDTSKAFPTKEFGVDLAVVAVKQLDLREKPETSSFLVKTLEFGSLLVIIEREKTNGWYNALDVDSGKDGWINADSVDVRFTQNKQPYTQLEKTYVNSTRQPEVRIVNDSNVTLYLTFGSSKYIISPNDSISFTVTPGHYKFYASSPGILPDFGEDDIQTGIVYTWTFYVVTQ